MGYTRAQRAAKQYNKKNIIILPSHPLEVETIQRLLAHGMSQAQIARALSVSNQAVSQYIAAHPTDFCLVRSYRSLTADKLKIKVREIIDSIDGGAIKRAGLRDRAVSSGILIDKIDQLEGTQSGSGGASISILVQQLFRGGGPQDEGSDEGSRDGDLVEAQAIDVRG